MRAASRGEGGFTLIEIMVSMALLVIGLLGILALQMTTVKGNRVSRELDRARVLAAEVMEDVRAKDISTDTGGSYPNVTTSDGVTYRRAYTVAAVSGSPTMRLITVTVTFAENDNPDDEHSATLQMLRTTQEKL
jgi:type IV pilus modification protein PilV